MSRTSKKIIWLILILLAAGCTQNTSAKTAVSSPGEFPTLQPAIETAVIPNVDSTQTVFDPAELLNDAVTALEEADSFQMLAHSVRSYKIINSDGTLRKAVYGEFNSTYTILREPVLKVHERSEYRFDPQSDFSQSELYTYHENGEYKSLPVEGSIPGEAQEIDPKLIEPLNGDVYQTLVEYADQAIFKSEDNGTAIYTLEHPKWYRLQGAIGFANLGILLLQPNSEQLIEQYVADHFPGVKTIRFTIYVSIKEKVISRVVVDDRDFMTSVWADVDRALIAEGEKPEDLTRYEVSSDNGAEYTFSNYNQVEYFENP